MERSDRPSAHLTRRTLLAGGAAALGGTLLTPSALARAREIGLALQPLRAPAGSGQLEPVAPLPDPLDRAAFDPQEQRFGQYVVTLAPMANDIDDSDTALRGYMAGGWWRTPSEPFNARISEHVATFAWFLSNERSWNPYYRDEALAARLDAGIDYYLRLQHEDGSWPEYSPEERSRAATAFALGYLSKTLEHLRRIDALPQRRPGITAALHRAMHWFLRPGNEAIWTEPVLEFANQPAAGLAGAAKALRLDPDPELSLLLTDRIEFFIEHAQSPAGFLYEPRGMDIAYNLNVTLTEFHEIHTELGTPVFNSTIRQLADWFSYTIVPEPDGAGIVSFASGAARTPMYFLDTAPGDRQQRDIGSVFCRHVPTLHALYPAREDRTFQRAQWADSEEPVQPLDPGDTNPRIPANIDYGEHYPTRRQRDVALQRLPAVANTRLTELRSDPQDQHYLFLRRPSYYVQAFLGVRPNEVVRAGLGSLWHPSAGTFVHSGQSSNTECWATVLPNGGTDSASDLTPTFYDGPVSDGIELPREDVGTVLGDLGLRWTTTGGNVTTEVDFTDDALVRHVSTTMDGVEQVPLVLRPEDEVLWSTGVLAAFGSASTAVATSLRIQRRAVTLTIEWAEPVEASLTPGERTYFLDASRRLHTLRVPHGLSGLISYRLT